MVDSNNLTTLAKRLRPLLKLGGGTGHIIEDEGSPLPNRRYLDFVGDGVIASDDEVNDATVVTIPGGGGEPCSCCGGWVEASGCHNGNTGYSKVENGWYMPNGDTRKASAVWQVSPGSGYVGPLKVYAVWLIDIGNYNGQEFGVVNEALLGYCDSIVAWEEKSWGVNTDAYIGQDNPDGYQILCELCACVDAISENDFLKLTAQRTAPTSGTPFTGDAWFIGWNIYCGGCPD